MQTYHKIQSIFKRDPENNYKTFLYGDWSVPAFGLLQDVMWTFTEKIDGTNIRVGWDGERVEIGGRGENSQIPAILLDHLREIFEPASIANGLTGPATLIGEGFGGKIQKGSRYSPLQQFILFDVFIEPDEDHPMGIWLEREAVEAIAGDLGIPVVPVIHYGSLLDSIQLIKNVPLSWIAEDPTLVAEGFVIRPSTELRDRFGHRIITKIKVKDFPKGSDDS